MSAMGYGQWIPRMDMNGNRFWFNPMTGEQSYQPVYGMGGTMGPAGMYPGMGGMGMGMGMGTGMGMGMGMGMPYHQYGYQMPYVPPSVGGGPNPQLLIGSWEKKRDSDGGKYWVNTVTGQYSYQDPWV